MTNKEIKDLVKGLKDYKKKVSASKKEARGFLVRVGVVDENGKKQDPYKKLCIR